MALELAQSLAPLPPELLRAPPLRHALAAWRAFRANDFVAFFRLARNQRGLAPPPPAPPGAPRAARERAERLAAEYETTPHVARCVMARHFALARQRALRTLCGSAYGGAGAGAESLMPWRKLARLLSLGSAADVADVARLHGLALRPTAEAAERAREAGAAAAAAALAAPGAGGGGGGAETRQRRSAAARAASEAAAEAEAAALAAGDFDVVLRGEDSSFQEKRAGSTALLEQIFIEVRRAARARGRAGGGPAPARTATASAHHPRATRRGRNPPPPLTRRPPPPRAPPPLPAPPPPSLPLPPQPTIPTTAQLGGLRAPLVLGLPPQSAAAAAAAARAHREAPVGAPRAEAAFSWAAAADCAAFAPMGSASGAFPSGAGVAAQPGLPSASPTAVALREGHPAALTPAELEAVRGGALAPAAARARVQARAADARRGANS